MKQSEDKQIGVYFVDKSMLIEPTDDGETIVTSDEAKRIFAYKVFEYLWNDVAKFSREKWFSSDIDSLDKLIDDYTIKGIKVFRDGIFPQK